RKIKPFKLGNIKITVESQAYVLSVLCTMLLCGLWHGASWTFITWGGLHGLYLAISFATRKTRKKSRKKFINKKWKPFYRRLRILFTFLIVSFLWIFFKAHSFSQAWYIVTHLFKGIGNLPFIFTDSEMVQRMVFLGQPVEEFIIALAAIGSIVLIHGLQPHEGIRDMFSQRPLLVRWMMYILLVLAIMNFGVFNEIPFIYSQF
ncbi:MAG: hypothetical protein JSV88_20030, partial [Candidatus Aminicenantes bacterium]